MKRTLSLLVVLLFLLFGAFAASSALPTLAAAEEQFTNSPATHRLLTNQDCLGCHSSPNIAREADGKLVSLHIAEKTFAGSVHGSLNCLSCHADIKSLPHQAPAKVNCGDCHKSAAEAYNRGLHAKAIQNGHINAATCLDCHGEAHAILRSSDPESKVNHANIAATCGKCHGTKFVMEGSGLSARPFLSYQESVHGRAVASGNTKAAVCSDCHSSHDIRPPTDERSTISKFNVPKTCGQCHQSIASEFGQSIHGQSLARGNWQAPVCTDCHGIHMIKPHIDPSSSVASQALAKTTCAQCHEGVRLSQEFGVQGKRASSYLDSYHGLASKLGSNVVANCASCHGVHNILPSSDPKSTISHNNLVETCGKCHPGASENFILGKVHLDIPASQDAGSLATRWVRWVYLGLITLVIGGMLLHNGLIWWKKALVRRRAADRTIVRMTRPQRVQHWLLLSSFFVLVLTGFALKYPDSWLADILGSSEAIRRVGHRLAAIVMLVTGVFHIGYLAFTRAGRQALKDMLPIGRDFGDLIRNLRYFAGRSLIKAQFGRFGYPEKAEYWAVVWGTMIMGLTGLMVWFKVGVFGFLPRWAIDVALAVHFYEAILATLAIVVWHFYHVIFDPDVYPLNWAVVDGKVSEEHFKEEHPLAFEGLARAKTNDSGIDGAEPKATDPAPSPAG